MENRETGVASRERELDTMEEWLRRWSERLRRWEDSFECMFVERELSMSPPRCAASS